MKERILITGSNGLIGTALRLALTRRDVDVVGLDLAARGPDLGDIRDRDRVDTAMAGCTGVVHLAAISRVVTAERDPDACRSTNVGGLRTVVEAACVQAGEKPWLIFTSSREVYGQPDTLPVSEDAPLRPMNTYGSSKVAGEQIVEVGRAHGLRTGIVRLSNVYGSTRDYADRVIPAFVRAAIASGVLRVDGADHTFDFTHVDDTVRGIVALAGRLRDGCPPPPPINLATGLPTTLGELAALTVALAGGGASITQAPPRSFDVARYYAIPSRAHELLGWTPRVSLREGLERLIQDYLLVLAAAEQQGATP